MLSQIKNIFFVANDRKKSTEEFSLFFAKKPYFKGFSKELGIEINSFNLNNLNISIINTIGNGLWSKKIIAFKKNKKEGLFGLDFMSTDLDEEYKNLKKLGISLSERKKISFIDDDKKIYRSDFFSIKENNISNLNISIGDESNFLREKEKSNASEGIKSINQVVIKTKDSDKIINLFKENMKIRLALDKTFKEWSGRMLFFRINGITIEVVEGDNLEDSNDYYGIGWHTDDFRRCYKSLVNNGFDLSKIRKGRKSGTLVSTLKNPILGIPTILIGLNGEIS